VVTVMTETGRRPYHGGSRAIPCRREKPQRDMAGRVGQAHGGQGDLQKERERGVKPGGTVGRDVADLSKEHNTEIAVEAGRKGGERQEESKH
jgi:hypothetical protein